MSRDTAFPLIMFKHMRDIYWLRNSSLLSKNCVPMGPTEARAGIAAFAKKLDLVQIAEAKKRAQQWKAAHSF